MMLIWLLISCDRTVTYAYLPKSTSASPDGCLVGNVTKVGWNSYLQRGPSVVGLTDFAIVTPDETRGIAQSFDTHVDFDPNGGATGYSGGDRPWTFASLTSPLGGRWVLVTSGTELLQLVVVTGEATRLSTTAALDAACPLAVDGQVRWDWRRVGLD